MYELSIRTQFAAAHSIRIQGEQEPVHGHHWEVTAVISGPDLDDDDLLCDFHMIEARLNDIVRPFHNRHLNEVEPFDALNPTAERVARYIGESLASGLASGLRLDSLTVTEAFGCAATWRPD